MMSEKAHNTTSVLTIDPSVYRLSAVKKAAYRLSARGDFAISSNAPDQFTVVMEIRDSGDDIHDLAREFRRQLLDQELREEIADKTAPISNLLLAQAFSATSLIHPTCDTAAYRSDPADICRPDSVRHGEFAASESQDAVVTCQ